MLIGFRRNDKNFAFGSIYNTMSAVILLTNNTGLPVLIDTLNRVPFALFAAPNQFVLSLAASMTSTLLTEFLEMLFFILNTEYSGSLSESVKFVVSSPCSSDMTLSTWFLPIGRI